MDENSIIERYRKQVEQQQSAPPPDVWENIATQLDIDEVWDNIAAELDRQQRRRVLWMSLAGVAASVAVLVIGSLVIFKPSTMRPEQQVVAHTHGTIETQSRETDHGVVADGGAIAQFEATIATPVDLNRQSSKKHQLCMGDHLASNAADTSAQSLMDQAVSPANSTNSIEAISTAAVFIIQKQPETVAQIASNEPLDEGRATGQRKLAVGFTAALKNTWLLNSETVKGLKGDGLNSAEVTIFPDIGVSLMYGFSPRWTAEFNLFLASRTGQRYMDYVYGQYTNKDIILKYTQMELLANYVYVPRWLGRGNISLVTALGAYYSSLSSASQRSSMKVSMVLSNYAFDGTNLSVVGAENATTMTVQKEITSHYGHDDYGVVAGFDLAYRMGARFTAVPGLRFKYGLVNIYGGGSNFSGNFMRTNNGSFEFRLTIYYNILGR